MQTLKTTEPLPARMRTLPVDERGYVVPWFVDWIDGKPEFRAMDGRKWGRAIRQKLCWVCGERMGRYMTFVAGPMCGINRTSSEPPCHLECAEWSARNCPFLSNPDQIRREDGMEDGQSVGGFAIKRNPGVTMLWTTKDYTVFEDGRGGHLITMGEPEHVQWYAQGRKATLAEVQASINSGIPNLENVAMQETGGLQHLRECRQRFGKYLPAA
jgi:hypothetical protein